MLMLKTIQIGNLTLRNRMVMPAMHLGYSPFGRITEQLLAFYRERAQGGVGMIVVGGCTINEKAGGSMFLTLKDDNSIAPMSQLASVITKHGAAACAQLYHAGRYVHSMVMNGEPALAPSALPTSFTRETPQEMTLADIRSTVKDFAAAALRAKEAGFNAVEIIASAGYLVCQFLSPISNARTDEYGGSLENRMRFGLEVFDAVREATGPNFVVGIRLAGNEFVPGGGGLELSKAFAVELDSRGVDYLSVTGGWHETRVPQILGEVPQGVFSYLTREIRRAVKAPVFLANRLGNPAVAEGILKAGLADVVCLGRPLIADPAFPKKLAEDKAKEIVTCVACNQGCFDSVMRLRAVCCMVNPRVGTETKGGAAPAKKSRKVLIVGGGPAGMQAAITAAHRGHVVDLYESEPVLGGQINIASVIPGKEPLIDVVRNLEKKLLREKARGNLRIHLSQKLKFSEITSLLPDAVVIATGARPIDGDLPGTGSIPVVQSWDVLSRSAQIGERVVVLGGGATGAETALFLAKEGAIDAATAQFLLVHQAEDPVLIRSMSIRGTKHVTLIELQKKIGRDIGPSTRWNVTGWLQRAGVDVRTETEAIRLVPEGLVVLREEKEEVILADTIVLALGAKPVAELAEQLKGHVNEIHIIGDAKRVRRALDATNEAFMVACKL